MSKTLPEVGTAWPELEGQMRAMSAHDVQWRDGKASVYIFHSGDDVMQVAHDAYGLFIAENGLGPAAFPSLRQMEREVVEIACNLQNAPAESGGGITSGGSESILLAIKACRDRARAERGSDQEVLEIVAPYSVHPAFDKGAHLMGLKVVRVPVGGDFRADVAAMAAAIAPNTVMLVGSAPCFPYGVIDPIEDLSDLAEQHDLWLHVDACVGGYVNPFLARVLKENPPQPYDFAVPGVTSMSLDLHKYGYAAKGASTLLFRDKALKQHQVFDFNDWPCGQMFTPTFAGTRPGGAISAAWAVLHHLGWQGYCERAVRIAEAKEELLAGLKHLGLQVFGDPRSSILAFGWQDGDILAVGEGLYADGWFSSRVTNPDGIQVMISPEHHKTMANYLKALEKNLADVAQGKRKKHQSGVSYS